ncbi:hypothetical protein Salat_1695800 [Sesamum alatum]|uniref:Uncharacterized protein n=1 Tax=Sesamum alatum TaxID=300844 RepID=A0AAE1Y7X8_9LAMI|nr:hypothetical protein Salat_1695800 [Sesamum alatum]
MELSKDYLYGGDPDYDALNIIFKEEFDRETQGSNSTVINISSNTDKVNIMQHNIVIDLTSNEDEVQSNIIVVTFDDEDHNLPSDVGPSNVPAPVYNFGPFGVANLANFRPKILDRKGKGKLPVEMFGRGGPAPRVGVGWGASGGDPLEAGGMGQAMQRLNCCLAACLIVGPGNTHVIDKLLKVIFHVPVLKYLDFGIHQFLCHKGYKPFGWNYEDEE